MINPEKASKHAISKSIVIFTILLSFFLFPYELSCCNPEPGALHLVRMPEPAPEPKVRIALNGYWRTYNKSSGFVNDHITFVKGLTVENVTGTYVGTRKSGVFKFSPSLQELSFNDWKLISEPFYNQEIVSGNDLEYRDGTGFYTATPVGVYVNDKLIDKDEMPLPSSNVIGIQALENGLLLVLDDCAYTTADSQKYAIPDNQRIVRWLYRNGEMILSTPEYLLKYDPSYCMVEKLQLPWCEVIYPLKDSVILGGIHKLKKYKQNEEYSDLYFQGDRKLWITCMCGTYNELAFKKPENEKMVNKMSVFDLKADQLKKEIQAKTKAYNKLCKEATDFLFANQTPGFNATAEVLDKYDKMVDDTLKVKEELKKLSITQEEISNSGQQNTLWIGTKRTGVFAYDQMLKKWTNLDKKNSPIKSNEITALYREGRYTWIGTSDGGLFRYGKYDLGESGLEPKLIEAGNFTDIIKNGLTVYGLKDKSSVLVFDALNRKKSWISSNMEPSLKGDLNDIDMDDQFALWIATSENGICRYDGTNWAVFTEESGLPSNDIQKIQWMDDTKTLMAASRTGIKGLSDRVAIFDGSAWEKYDFNSFKARLDKKSIRYRIVNETDFVYDNTMAVATAVHSFYQSEQAILIGTDAGLYVFNGEKWMKEDSLFKQFSTSINQIGNLPNGKILFASLTGGYTHDGKHYGMIPVNTMGQGITSFVSDDQDQQLFWFSSGVFDKHGTFSSYHLVSGETTMKNFEFAVNKIVIIAPYVFMATSKGLYYMRIIL